MASVNLTRALSTVYLVHPDDLPGSDDGLEQDALISKTDVKEVIDANGQVWFLLENTGVEDVLNGQKVPLGMVKKDDVEQVSVYNWAAFGFKTKDIASDQFIFQEDNNPLFKAICEELNGDTKDKHAPKPDVPGISRLMHDIANHLKLSRWVYKHASEWGGEADYKKQVKDFLENGAQDSEHAKERARRKYDRLEAKIANLSWWPEVSSKVKGFPSSAVVHHFNPAAFLEQMRRVDTWRDLDLSDPDKWMSQYDHPIDPDTACYRTCLIILERYDVECVGLENMESEKYENGTDKWSGVIQTVIQMKDGTMKGTGREKEGVAYLNEQLELGHPVIVGLDDGRNVTYNKDNSTEHFVVITGRLSDELGRIYFRFFEVGTHLDNKQRYGVGGINRLYLQDDGWLFGPKHIGTTPRNYTVCQIRKNKRS